MKSYVTICVLNRGADEHQYPVAYTKLGRFCLRSAWEKGISAEA